MENIAPVMSIRVLGPGACRRAKFSTKSAETMCTVRSYPNAGYRSRCRMQRILGSASFRTEQRMSRASEFAELDPETKSRWMSFGRWDRPYFPELVGVQMIDVRSDYCSMLLPFRPEIEQPMGIVHGGAIATLIDVVVVPAIGSSYSASTGFSTIDMHIQFLSALRSEDALAEGWVVKRGRRIVFCEAIVAGAASGRTIARGSLTYAVSDS